MAANQQNLQNMFQAMQMFREGVQDLQFRRILNNANEAVQAVRASELQEQEKLSEIQQIANQFATQAVGLQPATTVQAAQQGLGVTPFEAAQFQQGQQLELAQQRADLNLRNQAAQFGMEQQQQFAEAQLVDQILQSAGGPNEAVDVQRAINRVPDPEQRKQLRKRYVPGWGFAVDGADALRFRKLSGSATAAENQIDEVLRLYEEAGPTALRKLNPKNRALAASTLQVLRGALRLALIGSGQMSDQEQELLKQATPNPLEFSNIFGADRLRQLKKIMKMNLEAEGQAIGLNPKNASGRAPQTKPDTDSNAPAQGGGLRAFMRKRN